MRKHILSALIMSISALAFAQAPNGFGYQAAIRNNAGQPLISTSVKLRFSIHDLTTNGSIIYQETQSLTTSALGLVNCIIGSGSVVSGAYPSAVVWKNGSKFLQVEVDPAGGNSFVDLGTSQIMSVPYANYAGASKTSDTTSGKINPSQLLGSGASIGQVLKWDGNNWIPDVDASGGAGGGDNWGTQTVITNSSLSGSGTSSSALKIAQQGAANGQVLKWNGSNWVPANDSSFLIGGTGITISGNTINSSWSTSGNDISNNNSGNVGIGVVSPSAKLDISGDAKVGGNLGVNSTNPDANFVIKSSGGSNREALLEATSTTNYAGLQLRSNVGSNDVLLIRKYGQSASGTYADGTALARSASLVSGTSATKMILGTLSSTADLHFLTNSRTRIQVDKDGNIYTGLGLSSGAKLHITKGSNGYIGSTGGYFAPALAVHQDTTVKGYYSAGITSYSSSDNGAIGGYFTAGRKTSDTITNYGIYAETTAEASGLITYGYGVDGFSTGARYNYGNVGNGIASRANTLNIGVYGYASGASFSTTTAYGVYGFAEKAGSNFAGYFSGNTHVNGTFTATTKTFLIDHPLDPANKYLQFTCIESPDMMNIYNGNVVTDANGFATVTMPDYFEVANIDFKYQLTVLGQFAQAIVKDKIHNNQFVIQTDKPNVEVSWQVTGVRNDEYAKQNRIVPEYEKDAEDKGKFLHPELYNLPESEGIHFLKPGATNKVKTAPKP